MLVYLLVPALAPLPSRFEQRRQYASVLYITLRDEAQLVTLHSILHDPHQPSSPFLKLAFRSNEFFAMFFAPKLLSSMSRSVIINIQRRHLVYHILFQLKPSFCGL